MGIYYSSDSNDIQFLVSFSQICQSGVKMAKWEKQKKQNIFIFMSECRATKKKSI